MTLTYKNQIVLKGITSYLNIEYTLLSLHFGVDNNAEK